MSGLSTKDVKTGGEGGMPKTIQPGNTTAVMHGIKLDQPPFMVAENGYFVVLSLETPKPADDFVGFLLDKDNPTGGNYEGQVGRVKASRWAYKDGTTKGGAEISRDKEIMKFMKNLCEALDIMAWWDAADEKHPTIEAFIEAFNAEKAWEGKSINYCIAGREYYNKDGYVNHDLHLPKFSKAGIPFEAIDAPKGRILTFNEADHIEKAEPKEVENFEGEAETAENKDFLAEDDAPAAGGTPEFEL
jgi:hypothetical protein